MNEPEGFRFVLLSTYRIINLILKDRNIFWNDASFSTDKLQELSTYIKFICDKRSIEQTQIEEIEWDNSSFYFSIHNHPSDDEYNNDTEAVGPDDPIFLSMGGGGGRRGISTYCRFRRNSKRQSWNSIFRRK